MEIRLSYLLASFACPGQCPGFTRSLMPPSWTSNGKLSDEDLPLKLFCSGSPGGYLGDEKIRVRSNLFIITRLFQV